MQYMPSRSETGFSRPHSAVSTSYSHDYNEEKINLNNNNPSYHHNQNFQNMKINTNMKHNHHHQNEYSHSPSSPSFSVHMTDFSPSIPPMTPMTSPDPQSNEIYPRDVRTSLSKSFNTNMNAFASQLNMTNQQLHSSINSTFMSLSKELASLLQIALTDLQTQWRSKQNEFRMWQRTEELKSKERREQFEMWNREWKELSSAMQHVLASRQLLGGEDSSRMNFHPPRLFDLISGSSTNHSVLESDSNILSTQLAEVHQLRQDLQLCQATIEQHSNLLAVLNRHGNSYFANNMFPSLTTLVKRLEDCEHSVQSHLRQSLDTSLNLTNKIEKYQSVAQSDVASLKNSVNQTLHSMRTIEIENGLASMRIIKEDMARTKMHIEEELRLLWRAIKEGNLEQRLESNHWNGKLSNRDKEAESTRQHKERNDSDISLSANTKEYLVLLIESKLSEKSSDWQNKLIALQQNVATHSETKKYFEDSIQQRVSTLEEEWRRSSSTNASTIAQLQKENKQFKDDLAEVKKKNEEIKSEANKLSKTLETVLSSVNILSKSVSALQNAPKPAPTAKSPTAQITTHTAPNAAGAAKSSTNTPSAVTNTNATAKPAATAAKPATPAAQTNPAPTSTTKSTLVAGKPSATSSTPNKSPTISPSSSSGQLAAASTSTVTSSPSSQSPQPTIDAAKVRPKDQAPITPKPVPTAPISKPTTTPNSTPAPTKGATPTPTANVVPPQVTSKGPVSLAAEIAAADKAKSLPAKAASEVKQTSNVPADKSSNGKAQDSKALDSSSPSPPSSAKDDTPSELKLSLKNLPIIGRSINRTSVVVTLIQLPNNASTSSASPRIVDNSEASGSMTRKDLGEYDVERSFLLTNALTSVLKCSVYECEKGRSTPLRMDDCIGSCEIDLKKLNKDSNERLITSLESSNLWMKEQLRTRTSVLYAQLHAASQYALPDQPNVAKLSSTTSVPSPAGGTPSAKPNSNSASNLSSSTTSSFTATDNSKKVIAPVTPSSSNSENRQETLTSQSALPVAKIELEESDSDESEIEDEGGSDSDEPMLLTTFSSPYSAKLPAQSSVLYPPKKEDQSLSSSPSHGILRGINSNPTSTNASIPKPVTSNSIPSLNSTSISKPTFGANVIAQPVAIRPPILDPEDGSWDESDHSDVSEHFDQSDNDNDDIDLDDLLGDSKPPAKLAPAASSSTMSNKSMPPAPSLRPTLPAASPSPTFLSPAESPNSLNSNPLFETMKPTLPNNKVQARVTKSMPPPSSSPAKKPSVSFAFPASSNNTSLSGNGPKPSKDSEASFDEIDFDSDLDLSS